MWIARREYRELIERAAANEARVEGLTIQANNLARDLAQARFELTGKVQALPVFQYQREASPKTPPGLETGVSFDDMGDDAAHEAGFRDEI